MKHHKTMWKYEKYLLWTFYQCPRLKDEQTNNSRFYHPISTAFLEKGL